MCIPRIMYLRKLNIICITGIISTIVIILWKSNSLIDDVDRKLRMKSIDKSIKTQVNKLACKQPFLPVNSSEIMKFVHVVPNIDCSRAGPDWVKCKGSECVIQDKIKYKYGPITCSFTDLIRINDFEMTDGQTTETDDYYKLEKSDVVKVNCKSSEHKWSSTLTGIRMDNKIWDNSNWEELSHNSLKLNVLMFGFDSLSRNSFIRKLPKSYEYLSRVLNSIILKGYNIVGDGTPQALIPILTGKTELELPDTRKRLKDTKYVNSYPFIWNNFKEAGYVTGFFEDVPQLGTFTYRLNGFDETPTDHYMRPYYLASLGERSKWPKLCAGEIPRHKVMFNLIKDFYSVYKTKPKFLFAFHGELSHDDYNLVGVADDDLLELLKELHNSGSLNDTILITMADHGHRFAEIRNTVQGKQEERLPFFSFTFPAWFKDVHKSAYKNFKSNADKLTTPFDIYETLNSVLNLENVGTADITRRSVSLFSKIPLERSCADAYIEPHWCACLEWHEVATSDPIVERLGEVLVKTINNFTSSYQHICERLSILDIHWVTKISPNENLLKFNRNADVDGFVPDLTANMNVKSDMYQIKVMLSPGQSLFEATIKHFREEDKMELSLSDISRINMYGKQARCVENDLPHLRKYCYCKDD